MKRFWKFLNKFTELFLLIAIGVSFLTSHYEIKNLGITVGMLTREVQAFNNRIRQELFLYTGTLRKTIELLQDNQSDNFIQMEDIKKRIEFMNKELKKIDNIFRGAETQFGLENLDDCMRANVSVTNLTTGMEGSGSHIKIKGKSYILTCNHIISHPSNNFEALENKETIARSLELVKADYRADLALFKIHDFNCPYLEISNVEPSVGETVYAIGNPRIFLDVITSGIISLCEETEYVTTVNIFYGNSGGALLYKGKIVGVNVKIASNEYTFLVT